MVTYELFLKEVSLSFELRERLKLGLLIVEGWIALNRTTVTAGIALVSICLVYFFLVDVLHLCRCHSFGFLLKQERLQLNKHRLNSVC